MTSQSRSKMKAGAFQITMDHRPQMSQNGKAILAACFGHMPCIPQATASVQFCCIQETHLPMVQDWNNGRYHVSGRWRIQHTRMYSSEGGIDIINIYQKVWLHGPVDPLTTQRKAAWHALMR